MAHATLLGFPRIGKNRELKQIIESYWKGQTDFSAVQETSKNLRLTHAQVQRDSGIDVIPVNDFSLYDQMLDMSALLGVVPERYQWTGDMVDHITYFAMARGMQRDRVDVGACEMTKWFDTNYHYIVPEFVAGQRFKISTSKPFDEYAELTAAGMTTRPVLVGPLTYLLMGKGHGVRPLDLVQSLLPVYADILNKFKSMGADWVQLDEPALCLDLDDETRAAYITAYQFLRQHTNIKLFFTTYFGSLDENAKTAFSLPVDAIHLDLVRGVDQLDHALSMIPPSMILSMGVVNGRNIWRTDLSAALSILEHAAQKIGTDRIWVSSSCSLLHVPYDLDVETKLDPELKGWMAYAHQKLSEIKILADGLNNGRASIAAALLASDQSVQSRAQSTRIHNPDVAARLERQPLSSCGRTSPFPLRQKIQTAHYQLPLYPTTTIGSLPQTPDVRKARADFKSGTLSSSAYDTFLKEQIEQSVRFQEEIGIDVLVHGEFERNDMVEYFGEQLSGFAFTQNGWVQSYGSRCVKPPVIYGDVTRPHTMTVKWSQYAQRLTKKHMKGMLTGPVTILQWSFVRDDQPRSVTTHQIALALQDEVLDLERAGIGIIQIDEPAFREGLPLRRKDWDQYLTWAANAFKLSFTGVKDVTQIHTHMCYCEFNDIISSIQNLDADVISIETSRSQMELLNAFSTYKYQNEIGPGVYDIHSPRVPAVDEMVRLLERAGKFLDTPQIWVNPDCGLKTRGWAETRSALIHMVEAAKVMRDRIPKRQQAS